MPLQIWTRPLEADTTSMAAGIADAGRGIGQGLHHMAANLKREQEREKERADKAKKIRGMAKMFSEDLGLSEGDVQTKDAGELSGMVEGYFRQQIMQSDKAKRAALEDQIAQRQAESGLPAELLASLEDQTQPGQFPPTSEGFDQAVNKQSGLSPAGMAMLRAAASKGVALPASLMDDIIKPKGVGLDFKSALDLASKPEPGFGRGAVQVNANGTASVNFPPEAKSSLKVEPILLPDGSSSGKGRTADGELVDLREDKSKALTDAQANALQYSERMKFNNGILQKLETGGFDPSGVGAAVQNWTPNFLASEDFQKYDAARRNWVSAVLRKESGAAISKSEEEGAVKQYFPKLGDSPGTVAQKSALRVLAEENMRKAVGEISRDKASPSSGKPSDVLKQARDAIKNGKAPAAVKKRYKEITGQDYPE